MQFVHLMEQTSKKEAGSAEQASGKPTDPRRKRSREAILQAGRSLFSEHHPGAISTDEVIRVANVAKQTFYNHFTDKDDLVREILMLARTRIDSAVTKENEDQKDPARRVATAVSIYAAQALRNPEDGSIFAHLPLYDIAPSSAMHSPTINDLKAGLSEGRLAFFCLETGLAVLLGITQALIARIITLEHKSLAASTSQQFITLLLRGYGLSPIESELIASEATENIIRPAIENT